MAQRVSIGVARVYEPRGAGEGRRVLVDRLWPRGLRKDTDAFDEWCKEIAPSTELRGWYGHDRARFVEFGERYRRELDDPERAAAMARIRAWAADGALTLVTATKELDISQAAVLAALLG